MIKTEKSIERNEDIEIRLDNVLEQFESTFPSVVFKASQDMSTAKNVFIKSSHGVFQDNGNKRFYFKMFKTRISSTYPLLTMFVRDYMIWRFHMNKQIYKCNLATNILFCAKSNKLIILPFLEPLFKTFIPSSQYEKFFNSFNHFFGCFKYFFFFLPTP